MRDYISHVAPFLSDFAEETLMVSDAMGYESNPDFLIDRSNFNNNLIMYVPVSYTHLDVYKRQDTARGSRSKSSAMLFMECINSPFRLSSRK